MAEWLIERGIGETRAALVEDNVILEAAIERDDGSPRVGTIAAARFDRVTVPGRRGVALLDGAELWLEPLPQGLSTGRTLLVEIVREALPEPGRAKPPRARPAAADAVERPGPDLAARLTATGLAVVELPRHGPDRLEAAGWSELIDEATTGKIAFPGGALRLSLTPAMTLIDVDGILSPTDLASAGAAAAARAICRLAIAGSIGIDLPTVADRRIRQGVGAQVDAILPPPFERTAVNGFGFLQIVRRRERASLPELIAADPPLAAALALLRRAERGHGSATLVAPPALLTRLLPAWRDALARRRGGAIGLREDPSLPISASHAAPS